MVGRATWATVVVGVAGGFVCAAEPAGTDGNTPRTLAQYLTHAALHSAGLKAAFEDWQAALEQIPQAKALPDPKFTYDYFTQQIMTRQQAGVMQTFPWFGKITARTDAAAAAANAAHKRYEAKRLQISSEVKQAFYEYVYLAGATRIARENLALTQHFEETARTRHLAAMATHPDLMRAQIEVAKAQNELTTLEESRRPVVARLNAALNRPTEAALPWPREESNEPVDVNRTVLIAALKEHNPELQALDFDVERLDKEVAVAQRNFYPDIGVGAEWMQMPASGGGSENDWRVGVELNVPIWRGSYKAGELQARALARRARYERKNLENTLVVQAQRTLYEFENSGRQMKLYDDVLVPRTQELIATSEAAYAAGTVDFLNLISAQQTLLQFRLARERSWADQRQKLAELEMLAGTELAGPIVESKPGRLSPGTDGGAVVEPRR
jgi:outer membrane protein TolC